eukprot:428254_1
MEKLNFLPHTICIPTCIYLNIRLYRLRNNTLMKKQSLTLIFGFNIALLCCMMSNAISLFATLYMDEIFGSCHANILTIISIYFALCFLNIKTWLIYFHSKWMYYILQLKWQQLINPKVLHKGHKNNWYIINRFKYGNLLYIYKTFGFLHLIPIIINIPFIYLINDVKSWQLRMSCVVVLFEIFFIYISFNIYIVQKTLFSKKKDTFHIYLENNIQSKIWFIGSILAMIICMIIAVIQTNEYDQKLWRICLYHEQLIIFVTSSVISTVFLVCKDNKSDEIKDGIMNRVPLQLNTSSNNISNNTMSVESLSKEITLEFVLSSKKLINIFIRHLAREYSIETLLSYIEFQQYQEMVWQFVKDKNCEIIQLADNVPISAILESKYNDDKYIDMKTKAHYIYNKYIKVSSEYEINISGIQRDNIALMLDDLDLLLGNNDVLIDDIFKLFEECKMEMIELLRTSFNRFKYYVQFNEIVGHIFNSELVD